MSGSSEGSIFSCIKHEEDHAQPAGGTLPRIPPAPPPAAPPSPAPAQGQRQYEEICARLRDLEGRLKKAEERESALASALEGARSELKAVSARAEALAQRPAPPVPEAAKALAAAGEAARTAGEAFKAAGEAARSGGEAARTAGEAAKTSGEASAAAAAALKAAEEAASSAARLRAELAELRQSSGQAAQSFSSGLGLVEDRVRHLQSGLAEELKARFAALDTALMDASRKAGLAQEASASAGRRVEKSEERLARLQYLESRVESNEGKLGKIYDLEALAQALRVSVEGMEKNFDAAMRASAVISAENKRLNSDFEGLSRQVRQLTALFNQLRAELAFLMPKKENETEAR